MKGNIAIPFPLVWPFSDIIGPRQRTLPLPGRADEIMVPSVEDFSKCVIMADRHGRAQKFGTEEIFAKGLNVYKDWFCSAGKDNIYVDGDGHVFVGSCGVSGIIGNVFKGRNAIRTKWIKCTRPTCMCGSDMMLAKSKSEDLIPFTEAMRPDNVNYADGPPAEFEAATRIWEWDRQCNLNWDLSKRCNYSCSYCSPKTSNTTDRFRTWEELKGAYDEIERFFLQGRRAKFVFTGGEPTLNPSYLDLVKLASSHGHYIHTQTNGSRTPDYYSDLLHHSYIGFSVHLEFMKRERLYKVFEAVFKTKAANDALKWNWLGVRVMAGPGRVDEAIQIKKEISSLTGADAQLNQLVVAPLYDVETATMMMKYPADELERLNRHI